MTASVQPAHVLDDRDVADRIWAGRTDRAFAYRTLLDAGVPLALGSDAPVAPLDPWVTIAAAVHRSGDDRPSWHPEQQIPLSGGDGGVDGPRTVRSRWGGAPTSWSPTSTPPRSPPRRCAPCRWPATLLARAGGPHRARASDSAAIRARSGALDDPARRGRVVAADLLVGVRAAAVLRRQHRPQRRAR